MCKLTNVTVDVSGASTRINTSAGTVLDVAVEIVLDTSLTLEAKAAFCKCSCSRKCGGITYEPFSKKYTLRKGSTPIDAVEPGRISWVCSKEDNDEKDKDGTDEDDKDEEDKDGEDDKKKDKKKKDKKGKKDKKKKDKKDKKKKKKKDKGLVE